MALSNKKAVLSQRWPRDALYMCTENFRVTTPMATFPKVFHGLLIRSTLWMCLQNLKNVSLYPFGRSWDNSGTENLGSLWLRPDSLFSKILMGFVRMDPVNIPDKFEVRSFSRSWDNRRNQKNWSLHGYAHTHYSPNSYRLPYGLRAPIVSPQFSIGVLSGRTSNLGEGNGRGSGMVPSERALVSSYRHSMVTFPLPLRISQISPLLCSSRIIFSTPPLVSPKFLMFPWVYVDGLWATKSDGACCALSVKIVSMISNLCDQTIIIHQRHRQTDKRTDRRTACDRKRALWTVVHRSRGKN